ncbi:MAG: hypothetical protein ACXW2E_01200 [Nitrososphaeraceae archaeon]
MTDFGLNIPTFGWSCLISGGIWIGVVLLAEILTWLNNWTDDKEYTVSYTPNLLFFYIRTKLMNYHHIPERNEYRHNTTMDFGCNIDLGFILLVTAVLLPIPGFVVIQFPYVGLFVLLLIGLTHLIRYARRINKVIQAHVSDKSIHLK